MTTNTKNFAVVYSKKARRKKKLARKLKLYKSYSTVDLAAKDITQCPYLKELANKNNIYIIELVE